MAIMEPLTIGTAVSGLLTSAIKSRRLLKSFMTSPDSPQSMKVVLNQLISISSVLTGLKPFLDNPATVPSEVHGLISTQYLVVPLTSCVMTFSQLERLLDTVRTDPKGTNRLYARMEGISSLDYINASLPEEDVTWSAENSEAYLASRRRGNGAEKDVVGLAVLDDGLDWMSLADYDEGREGDSDEDEQLPVLNKRKWDEEQVGDVLKNLQTCQELLAILAGLFPETSQPEISISRLSELTSQILKDDTLKAMHNMEMFEPHAKQPGTLDVPSPDSTTKHPTANKWQLASQLYLYGDLAKDSSITSPAQRPPRHDISHQPIPILPSHITNRAWYRFPLPPTDPNATTFHITVKSLAGKIIPCKISTSTTCLELKQVIERTEGPRLHQQYLVCEPDHRWLPEDVVLYERGVGEGSRIHLLLPFWGRGRM
ncbi:hypothetical protein BKA64DRAFT_665698 [Cadophora sp. MPI-SDFR-AT-0126]|nr:hypothetical protein BKA64DRAFT_665698 [Leotiomycetes sp. MPI-SDFR-AT-0126]